jgi:hypothetical protein
LSYDYIGAQIHGNIGRWRWAEIWSDTHILSWEKAKEGPWLFHHQQKKDLKADGDS